MRRLALVLPILALAACEAPMSGPAGPGPDVAMTPFTWKANTPIATRGYDINQCELQGRGLEIGATDAQIAAATASVDEDTRTARVNSCLAQKGYTVTEVPVCRPADYGRGTFMQRPETLPPLETIVCADPSAGGFVSTQPMTMASSAPM